MHTSAAILKPLAARRYSSTPTLEDVPSGGRNRKAIRFRLTLPVRYRTDDDSGRGELVDISSCGALFTTERPLAVNSEVKLSVRWPVLLADSVHLSLVIVGKVVRVEPGRAALQLQKYEYRTCSPSFFQTSADLTPSRIRFGLQVQVANHAVQRIGV